MNNNQPVMKISDLTNAVRGVVNKNNIGENSNIEQYWEELESIYQSSAEAIIVCGQSVNEAIAVPGVKENIHNVNEVNIAINGLNRDLVEFTNTLVSIHNKHAGKTGPIRGEKDIIESINIYEDYVAFNTKFSAVTAPTVLSIMDIIGQTVQNITSEAKNQQTEQTKEV